MSLETRDGAARISVHDVAQAVTDGVLRAVEARLREPNQPAPGKLGHIDISRCGGRFEFYVDMALPGNIAQGAGAHALGEAQG